MTSAELYGLIRQEGANADRARILLGQTHWYAVNAEFDPKTGEALPQSLSTFLAKVAHPKQSGTIQDRLHRITEHARPAVERLLRSLNESPRREQAFLPVHAVRELDANSFIKLSNRPGRNIREKLAGKPYLQAVRRYQSVNLPENRLLKAFVVRLAEFLELRRDLLGEAEDDLISRIHSWVRGDEAEAIARWENLSPNNTLLSHRDYRRVWDSWRRMQTLDEDLDLDLSRLDERQQTMTRWMEFGRMYGEGEHLFAEMPVMFDCEDFSIQAWLPELLVESSARKLTRSHGCRTVTEPACVDLAEMRPRFAVSERDSQSLSDAFLWQQWKSDSETVEVTLFDSDAAYLHSDAFTIASPDLFFGADKTSDHWDRAARAFAARLRETFRADKLIWLVPDALDDFELEIIRRNLNARFPGAEPLPRSVAAVFDQVDYNRITEDGYPVLVVDTLAGTTCATKLIARFDTDLRKRLPGTNGFYWERCPPVIISKRDAGRGRPYDMVTVDGDGEWRSPPLPERPQFVEASHLKANPRIGNFAFCINLSDSPVAGGMRLHAMQASAGEIPLWRDQIPELSIKVIKDGRYQRFYLVSRGTTIKPIRGLAVQIPIAERFILPAGKRFYQFPLSQGENADELRFSARLDSPAFSLKSNLECELILTFHYGDDEPYNLVFVPLDRSFPPVRATWQRTVEEIVTDAPAPVYPQPLSWDELRRMPKPGSEETSDLLEWFVSAIDRLDSFVRPRPRTVGTLITEWIVDRNGDNYAFADCKGSYEDVFIHQRAFLRGIDFSSFDKGDQLSFEIQERNGKFSGSKVAHFDLQEHTRLKQFDEDEIREIINHVRKGLYFPAIQIWRDGRSISDRECPESFWEAASERIRYVTNLAAEDRIPKNIQGELQFLLACLHKDTSEETIQWITDQVESGSIRDSPAIGFALGDVSQEWQNYIFDVLASKPSHDVISIFAYAIWREQNFVEQYSLSKLRELLNSVLHRLENIRPTTIAKGGRKDKWAKRKWARATAEPLELLLGLLRTRASGDPGIRMLLRPHQEITKQLAEQVDRIEEVVAQSHIVLFSRVQIDVQKPEGVGTSDLLYALRLYLTGDDGANAVHITGVSDTDDD